MTAEQEERLRRLKALAQARLQEVHLDRARLVTESYRATEGQPVILRRAQALAHFFRHAPAEIREDELLVADRAWIRPYPFNFPDISPKAVPRSDDPAVDRELQEIWSYWQRDEVVAPTLTTVIGHCVPGFQKMLELGFDGIAEEARKALATCPAPAPSQVAFWQAAILLSEACGEWGRRYAREARAQAEKAAEPRRSELLAIAEVCDRVPAQPARTFREALQALWFGELLVEAEDPPNAHSPGRLDQLLWPYYERDRAAGRLTREDAWELLACYWLKMWEPYDVHDTVIGGRRPDGQDATNELSYLILEVQSWCGLHRQLSVRLHRETPEPFLRQACEVVREGLGVPQWFNDDVLIDSLVAQGIPREEANDYAIIGCIETTLPGRADPRAVEHWSNLPKCLEYALTNGECLTCGERNGPQTGDLSEVHSFEDLWARYAQQVEYEVAAAVEAVAAAERRQIETYPMILLSLLTDDCVRRGLDVTEGGARYNSSMFCACGIPNVADSLAALKRLVFEEGWVTLEEVVAAMRANFEGYERLRQRLLNDVPKYGSDDDYVDSLARDVAVHYAEVCARHRNPRGGPLWPSYFTFTLCLSMGQRVGASPDGRLAGWPLANSLCASQGPLSKGPSALVKSAAKLEQHRCPAGTALLLDLHPSFIARRNGQDPLADLLRTYFDLGGTHAEVTLVDEKRLREAQAHPERYPHLTVRVAGYSARFVTLSREAQDHLIARTRTAQG
jgi:pyruvate formate-lyase/glycerol dehydratase family glycyl radical enzyme